MIARTSSNDNDRRIPSRIIFLGRVSVCYLSSIFGVFIKGDMSKSTARFSSLYN